MDRRLGKSRTSKWPAGAISWFDGRTKCYSIPFTWELPRVRGEILRGSDAMFLDRILVGGPAVRLMPGFFRDIPCVTEGDHYPGVLQRIHPGATRTTLGCPNRCGFCGIGKGILEGEGFRELDDWPDGNVLLDANLFRASEAHFDRVMDRLELHEGVDFHQGVDPRLCTSYHAERIGRLRHPIVRLAMDHRRNFDAWDRAFGLLIRAGVRIKRIRSYMLVGYDSGPEEAWDRARLICSYGVAPLPMWFHELDAMRRNAVTPDQIDLGWTSEERKRFFQFWYQHQDRDKRLKREAA